VIEVEGGDTVIDAGVGWGDTTVYLAALANRSGTGHSYAFDILDEGLSALGKQLEINPTLNNITAVRRALSDEDGDTVSISGPGPGAQMVKGETGATAETLTIDGFVKERSLRTVDFIKMDIEGAELRALKGASETIRTHKPKLAISVYHEWDDLLLIPRLIKSLRSDYRLYLDCTTGFGGETVLYCR
jgi:FkbM family methyltransferase